ncbi:chromosome partition protein Smc-like isoform X2 [Euwallacea fornicatus]|uniref:chromosome partition protein Smc-like isoform X2 n=1 Tax=Euwallacea fornicatus TaxID=995702 RepID=UPI00338E7EB5
MHFLEKLCRICVQTGAPVVDIETVDFDSVRLSEKLQNCANLEISEDSISTAICEKCVNKLRVSYHFLNMCKKSTNIIQGYVDKLNFAHDKYNTETVSNDNRGLAIAFRNSELNVEIEKLSIESDNNLFESSIRNYSGKKKQRITKGQRCSLLQQLLNRPKRDADKSIISCYPRYDHTKGGLKSIIDFTRNYEFTLDKNSNIETTPLDKLTAFSKNYFKRDFSEFRDHILDVIESEEKFEYDSDFESQEEDFLSEEEDGSVQDNIEEVVVEQDTKIKKEIIIGNNDEDEDSRCPLDYLETSFEEMAEVKNEPEEPEFEVEDHMHDLNLNLRVKEDPAEKDFSLTKRLNLNSSPAVKLLDRLVASYPMNSRKVFSSSNVRCRTRDHPYINPILKNQFLYRSFKCERCNRSFKSQGYLKAHTSKVH